jgi:GAF domain-containing protein
VSILPPDDEGGDARHIVAGITEALSDSRLSVGEILSTVANGLSRLRAGTWVVSLMNKDPSTSLVIAADPSEPALVNYINRYVTELHGPGQAPTAGLSQRVIESGTPLVMPALSYEELLSLMAPDERGFVTENPPPFSVTSIGLLIVPMRTRGATLGTIGLYDRGPALVTGEDAGWLQLVADRTAMAIDNAQLFEDAIKRLERLSSLQRINHAIAATSDFRFMLKVILDQVKSELSVDAADVLVLDETERTLSIAASIGFLSTSMPAYKLSLDEGLPGRAIASRRTELLNAVDAFANARRRSLFAREGFEAYATVPLTVRGRAVGALEIFHRSPLNPDHEWISFLEAIGSVAAIAIDSSAMRERLQAAGDVRSEATVTLAPEMSRVERQVLGMVVEGLTNREISAQIHLSQNTIKFHVRRLLQKAGVSNRTELARKTTQEGWL